MNKTLKLILIIVGAVILLFVVLKMTIGREKTEKVKIEVAELRNISETVSANGRIQPEVDVRISSQVSGQIVELPVKEGDIVQEGDLLLRINPDIYEAAFNRASAALNNARSNLATAKAQKAQIDARFRAAELSYERSQNLFNQGAISQAEWDNAVANYEVAQSDVTTGSENIKAAEFSISSATASVKEARDNLSRTTILAPKAGTITALTKELGESVLGNNMMAGEVIMSVSDLQTMEVDVEVNESDIVRVNLMDSVDIEVDAFLDRTFKGVVTEIGNTALNAMASSSLDAVTNFSVKVRILESSYEDLKNDGSSPFRPGMSANVEIQTAFLEDVVCVPIKAVSLRSDTSSVSTSKRRFGPPQVSAEKNDEDQNFECVLVVSEENSQADLRVVKTGIQDIDYIQIIEGVEEGEWVIVSPFSAVKKLKDKEDVEFSEPKSKDEDE